MNGSTGKIRAIVTGVTGMVGEGVLHECLHSSEVEKVLVLGRRPCGISHPILQEIVLPDIGDLSSVEDRLSGYNACFFCAGVSSVGMKEEQYVKLTYTLTLNVANTLSKLNPGMTFCYISGAGTDSTERGRMMWARVKGRTENDLKKLPFKAVYNFRPGVMTPTKGLKNTLKMYNYLGWLMPVLRVLTPNAISTLAQVGQAMINAVTKGYEKQTLEVPDIKELAGR